MSQKRRLHRRAPSGNQTYCHIAYAVRRSLTRVRVCSYTYARGRCTRQSLQFLLAVMEFKGSGTDYRRFVEIVDKFVRDTSPFEVNISSKAKTTVLGVSDAASFAGLPEVSAGANALLLANR